MPDLSLLIGAGVFAAGLVTGRAWPGRKRKPRSVEPLCGCKHHYSFHDPKTSACHGKNYEGNFYYAPCTCRAYAGPTPMPEYYAPEIAN